MDQVNIDRYLRGELDRDEAQQIERDLLSDPEGLDRAYAALVLRRALARQQLRTPAPWRWAWKVGVLCGMATAALLLVLAVPRGERGGGPQAFRSQPAPVQAPPAPPAAPLPARPPGSSNGLAAADRSSRGAQPSEEVVASIAAGRPAAGLTGRIVVASGIRGTSHVRIMDSATAAAAVPAARG
jgi:hypothetical protein